MFALRAPAEVPEAATRARAMVERRGESTSEAARYARGLIEVSLNPLVSIDPQGRITDVNAATVEAIGIPRDQLHRQRLRGLLRRAREGARGLSEGPRGRPAQRLSACAAPRLRRAHRGRVQRRPSTATRAASCGPCSPPPATPPRHRKHGCQVARLAALAAASHDAIYTRDLEGMITSWNAAAEVLYDYAADEAIGRNGTILMPPGREGETQELIKRMLRGDRDLRLRDAAPAQGRQPARLGAHDLPGP